MFTAYDVGRTEITDSKDSRYPFGIGVKKCADEFRLLADQLERGQLILQEVEEKTTAIIDDFPMTQIVIRIRFYEEQPRIAVNADI